MLDNDDGDVVVVVIIDVVAHLCGELFPSSRS